MKRALLAATAALLVTLCAPAAASAASFVVTFEDSIAGVDDALDALRKELRLPPPRHRYASALKGFAADLTEEQAARLRSHPAVAGVEPDVTVAAAGMEAVVAGESVPAGIRRIGAATTALVHQPAATTVAVLDTGVDLASPDLDAVSGTNCIKPGTAAQDDNGHGTNVAGIIAGSNTGRGVVGVAPGTRIVAVKVLNNKAVGTLSQFLCGIDWVAANASALGVDVANMSIAGAGMDDGNCGRTSGDAEHKAICAATAAGVTFVVSAGNSARDFAGTVPASYSEVLTATAMTDTDGLPGGAGPAPCSRKELDDHSGAYSNFAVAAGDAAHTIAAPGTCVTSAGLGGKTSTYTGTSQAAPHVAGAVALCHGSPGLPGPCADLAPAQVIARVRADASAAATLANGFAGDPLRPLSGKVFGPLLTAGAY